MMFDFQWPWLILLLPLPILVRYLLPPTQIKPESGASLRFPHLTTLTSAYPSQRANRNLSSRVLKAILYGVWVLLTVALMRPQIVNHLTNVKNEGHDLMLAVDLSGSMQSLDFATPSEQIDRLDVAKKVVGDFLEKRRGDRVGLILFGEHAYLNAPLTLDTKAVRKLLDNSLPGMAGDATAIGDAIGLAVKNLRDRPAKSRAIILLTDGEDNASSIPPLQAAEIAKQYGIHIYTIVIGKEGQVPFPDGQGGIVMVDSSIDTALTRQIAEVTGGEFFKATDQASLSRIYDRIDTLEKSQINVQTILIRTPLYPYPLGLALALLIGISFFVQLRREWYGFVAV